MDELLLAARGAEVGVVPNLDVLEKYVRGAGVGGFVQGAKNWGAGMLNPGGNQGYGKNSAGVMSRLMNPVATAEAGQRGRNALTVADQNKMTNQQAQSGQQMNRQQLLGLGAPQRAPALPPNQQAIATSEAMQAQPAMPMDPRDTNRDGQVDERERKTSITLDSESGNPTKIETTEGASQAPPPPPPAPAGGGAPAPAGPGASVPAPPSGGTTHSSLLAGGAPATAGGAPAAAAGAPAAAAGAPAPAGFGAGGAGVGGEGSVSGGPGQAIMTQGGGVPEQVTAMQAGLAGQDATYQNPMTRSPVALALTGGIGNALGLWHERRVQQRGRGALDQLAQGNQAPTWQTAVSTSFPEELEDAYDLMAIRSHFGEIGTTEAIRRAEY